MDNRDDDIISEYRSGKEPDEIARANDLSARRIKQILSENGVTLLERLPRDLVRITRMHELIGLHLYYYADAHGIEPYKAANQPRGIVIRNRKISRGFMPLELLAPLNILTFARSTLEATVMRGYQEWLIPNFKVTGFWYGPTAGATRVSLVQSSYWPPRPTGAARQRCTT